MLWTGVVILQALTVLSEQTRYEYLSPIIKRLYREQDYNKDLENIPQITFDRPDYEEEIEPPDYGPPTSYLYITQEAGRPGGRDCMKCLTRSFGSPGFDPCGCLPCSVKMTSANLSVPGDLLRYYQQFTCGASETTRNDLPENFEPFRDEKNRYVKFVEEYLEKQPEKIKQSEEVVPTTQSYDGDEGGRSRNYKIEIKMENGNNLGPTFQPQLGILFRKLDDDTERGREMPQRRPAQKRVRKVLLSPGESRRSEKVDGGDVAEENAGREESSAPFPEMNRHLVKQNVRRVLSEILSKMETINKPSETHKISDVPSDVPKRRTESVSKAKGGKKRSGLDKYRNPYHRPTYQVVKPKDEKKIVQRIGNAVHGDGGHKTKHASTSGRPQKRKSNNRTNHVVSGQKKTESTEKVKKLKSGRRNALKKFSGGGKRTSKKVRRGPAVRNRRILDYGGEYGDNEKTISILKYNPIKWELYDDKYGDQTNATTPGTIENETGGTPTDGLQGKNNNTKGSDDPKQHKKGKGKAAAAAAAATGGKISIAGGVSIAGGGGTAIAGGNMAMAGGVSIAGGGGKDTNSEETPDDGPEVTEGPDGEDNDSEETPDDGTVVVEVTVDEDNDSEETTDGGTEVTEGPEEENNDSEETPDEGTVVVEVTDEEDNDSEETTGGGTEVTEGPEEEDSDSEETSDDRTVVVEGTAEEYNDREETTDDGTEVTEGPDGEDNDSEETPDDGTVVVEVTDEEDNVSEGTTDGGTEVTEGPEEEDNDSEETPDEGTVVVEVTVDEDNDSEETTDGGTEVTEGPEEENNVSEGTTDGGTEVTEGPEEEDNDSEETPDDGTVVVEVTVDEDNDSEETTDDGTEVTEGPDEGGGGNGGSGAYAYAVASKKGDDKKEENQGKEKKEEAKPKEGDEVAKEEGEDVEDSEEEEEDDVEEESDEEEEEEESYEEEEEEEEGDNKGRKHGLESHLPEETSSSSKQLNGEETKNTPGQNDSGQKITTPLEHRRNKTNSTSVGTTPSTTIKLHSLSMVTDFGRTASDKNHTASESSEDTDFMRYDNNRTDHDVAMPNKRFGALTKNGTELRPTKEPGTLSETSTERSAQLPMTSASKTSKRDTVSRITTERAPSPVYGDRLTMVLPKMNPSKASPTASEPEISHQASKLKKSTHFTGTHKGRNASNITWPPIYLLPDRAGDSRKYSPRPSEVIGFRVMEGKDLEPASDTSSKWSANDHPPSTTEPSFPGVVTDGEPGEGSGYTNSSATRPAPNDAVTVRAPGDVSDEKPKFVLEFDERPGQKLNDSAINIRLNIYSDNAPESVYRFLSRLIPRSARHERSLEQSPPREYRVEPSLSFGNDKYEFLFPRRDTRTRGIAGAEKEVVPMVTPRITRQRLRPGRVRGTLPSVERARLPLHLRN